jgi:hypothetical protein
MGAAGDTDEEKSSTHQQLQSIFEVVFDGSVKELYNFGDGDQLKAWR